MKNVTDKVKTHLNNLVLKLRGRTKPRIDKPEIDKYGSWQGENKHYFDKELAAEILDFVKAKKLSRIIDVGCGVEFLYSQFWALNGVETIGIDGNKHINQQKDEINFLQLKQINLAKPIRQNIQASFVVCLEVGEHIPPKYEKVFLSNLARLSKDYLLISWCPPTGGKGHGHFNELPEGLVIEKITVLGFSYLGYFNTWKGDHRNFEFPQFDKIMLFRKKQDH